MFNPEAWSNTDLILEWIKHMYTPSSKYPLFPRHSTTRPLRFLSLDDFAGQKTKEVIASFKALKFTTTLIPSGTTGFVQVCDTVVTLWCGCNASLPCLYWEPTIHTPLMISKIHARA
jgi:hypothetical protein